MFSSQNSQKFRTPYRHGDGALLSVDGPSSQASCSDPGTTPMEQDFPGDMLDLIRSQKASQHQPTPTIQKKRPKKIPKRQLFHEKTTTNPKEPCPVAVPIKEQNNASVPREKRVPKYIQTLTEDRMTPNHDPRLDQPSSEVYEFPASPTNRIANLGISRKRRLVEKQVLRTIKKIAEEIQYFRLRKEELRTEYPELCR